MPFQGSTVLIEYKYPGGSYVDITNDCIFDSWSFTSQMAATPGSFEGTVRDPNQVHSFITGGELRLTIDGVILWGGYILTVQRTFAFPADNTVTVDPSAIKSRQWKLTGADYNFALDKLVARNPADYTHQIPQTTHPIYDGAIIRTYYPLYFDVPAGWDLSTYVLDNFQFTGPNSYLFGAGNNGNGQGFSMRDSLADLTQYGSVAYMGPEKALRFLPVQNTAAPWGFSDAPAKSLIADSSHPWIGFRNGGQTEDLNPVVNDAFVWGGSIWANNGAVVFDREQNAASIAAHGRWQYAEVKVGDARYKSLGEVTARAKTIISGNTTGTTAEGQQGRALPEEQYRVSWFGNRVPVITGQRRHLPPGLIVTLDLWTFSQDAGVTPFKLTVPLRSVTISFPSLDPTGKSYVVFDGMFGVLVTDPEWLWAFLRGTLGQFQRGVVGGVFSTAGSGTTGAVPYGTEYNGPLTPSPNGAATVFTIPQGYAYVAGTTVLQKNGLIQQLGVDYTESDPAIGQVTWVATDTLVTGDFLWLRAILAG